MKFTIKKNIITDISQKKYQLNSWIDTFIEIIQLIVLHKNYNNNNCNVPYRNSNQYWTPRTNIWDNDNGSIENSTHCLEIQK